MLRGLAVPQWDQDNREVDYAQDMPLVSTELPSGLRTGVRRNGVYPRREFRIPKVGMYVS